jgi:hypothetical protein
MIIDKLSVFILRVGQNTEKIFVNTWDFWVFPAQLPMAGDDILVVSTLNKAALAKLEEGGKVLLTVEKGSIKEGKGGDWVTNRNLALIFEAKVGKTELSEIEIAGLFQ